MTISTEELERQLELQMRAAIKLRTRRKELRTELAKVERLLGLELCMVGLQHRQKKIQNETSLRTKVFEVLKNCPAGLTLNEIVKRVIPIGHQCKSLVSFLLSFSNTPKTAS